MNDLVVAVFPGIIAGTISLQLAAFFFLRKIKQANKAIESREQEIAMLIFLLNRSKHHLHETTSCAEEMHNALHRVSYYNADQIDAKRLERISEHFKELKKRNAAVSS
jgi:hypothetical protein